MNGLFCFVILAILGNEVCSGCDGFVTYKTSCYMDFNIRATWAEASMICRAYGGYLANINDVHEQHYIQNYISRNIGGFSPGIFWLGGTDIQIEDEWIWTGDVTLIDDGKYQNWFPNEPNNAGGKEHCMEMSMQSNYQWNDNSCSHRYNFICEVPSSNPIVIGGGGETIIG